ncbi:PKD domain-containing protein [Cohnella sp. AR92]|uniref:PKD domain-containing protein n=1 Tax=Cohnella sp. AR92 TaxID=648716 RepID=UPI000F8F7CF2|nr:PKD domain-containing protein [Cohnella sp. AR92]RUS47688.1 hypothetical protein ELR57_07860 [Cohnella sp. AR92]
MSVTTRAVYKDYFNSKDYIDKIVSQFVNNGAGNTTNRDDLSTVNTSLTIKRSDFNGTVSMTKTLTGKGTLFAFGGYVSSSAEKTITIKLAVESGTPNASCSCNPSEVTFDGSEVTTVVTVNAAITGVSGSSISKWIFYGHDGDGGQQQTTTVTPSGDKTKASTAFTYKTPASKMTGDSYVARFEQRVVLVFADGTRKETGLAVCTTTIVKPGATPPPTTPPETEPPEVVGPSGPVAVISGPTKVKANQPLPFPITGEKSFDWDSVPIVQYTWDQKLVQKSPIYDIRYDEPGTYTVILSVKNGNGVLSEEDTHTIEVVPDEPPVTSIAVPPEETRLGNVRVQSNAYSPDGDTIASHTFEMKYDSNNNGFEDESWKTVQTGAEAAYIFKPDRVGRYLFRETACETYGACANTDKQPENERTLIVHNLAPTIDVVTSSNQTDTSNQTLLPMSALYHSGTVTSLDTGVSGDKSGWTLQNETLSTMNYRTDIGMFNMNMAVDSYYGDDFIDRTLYASMQNTPTLEVMPFTSTQLDPYYADERYIYKITGLPIKNTASRLITLYIYDHSMQLVRTVPVNLDVSITPGLTYTRLMVKGDLVFISMAETYSANNPFTTVINRETGEILVKQLAIASPIMNDTARWYNYQNGLYADSKGIIGTARKKSAYNYNNQPYITGFDSSGLMRVEDLNALTTTDYFKTQDHLFFKFFLPRYISQKGPSLYFTGQFDDSVAVIYDTNLVQTGSLQQPAGNQRYTWQLIGVDDAYNFYSSGRIGEWTGPPIMAVHDRTGKLLRTFPYPTDLQGRDSYVETYSDGSTRTVYFQTEGDTFPYHVDAKGNMWFGAKGKAIAVTPTGEEKYVHAFKQPNSTSTPVTFKILEGSDGLITFFTYQGSSSKINLEVTVIDPATYSVVSDTDLGQIWSYKTNGTETSGLASTTVNKTTLYAFNVIPTGDQTYLLQAITDRYNAAPYVYKISSTGELNRPKKFEIGTPTKDLWLGSKVGEGLVLQGSLQPKNDSAAAAGYVYLAQDKDNYYSAEFEDGKLKVKKTVAGVTQTVFSKAYSFVAGQTYTLKFVPEGTGFSLYVNRLKQTTIEDSGWTSGKYGVISRGQPGVSFFGASTAEPRGATTGKIYGVVLVNEPLTYDVTFDDPESDKRITAGEAWIYSHNPNVFLNPQGAWSDAGKSFDTPVPSFSLPGEYPFRFRTKDDPNPDYPYPSDVFDSYRQESNEVNGTIRVHRRPIASFTAAADDSGNVVYTNSSYDPDRYNPTTGAYSTENTGLDYQSTKGIFTTRWRLLTPKAAEFKYVDHPPTKVTESGHYVIELQVQDEYGAWAEDWARQEFDVAAATPIAPPVAGFTISPITTFRGVPVTINSTAFDPQDGDRTMIAHQYYLKPSGGAETLASTSRTSWEKAFNSLGIFTLRQIVTNSYGLKDEATGQIAIVNRKPMAQVTNPTSSDSLHPTELDILRPTFTWSYLDEDHDPQSKYQLRIYKYGGYSYLDTGEISSSAKSWTPSSDLPEEINFYVMVRVYDGYDWSGWSDPKYFVIVTNKAPDGDFDWIPKPAYEGDTVQLSTLVSDPDQDMLDISYEIVSPTGEKSSYAYQLSFPYPTTGSVKRFAEPGRWTVTMTVSDRKAPAATVTHSIEVLPLGIVGYVRHTEAWEKNRLAYNEKNPKAPRPAEWFWAGEAFVLDAVTTDTGSSSTKPVEVTAAAGETLKHRLAPVNPSLPVNWNGLLGSKEAGFPLSELPEGLYTFVFTVRYSNGTVKTAAVTIRIVDQVGNYVQVHRIT